MSQPTTHPRSATSCQVLTAHEFDFTDAIITDRVSGTPGPWGVQIHASSQADSQTRRLSIVQLETAAFVIAPGALNCDEPRDDTDIGAQTLADARRIARVPQMENQILADAQTISQQDKDLMKLVMGLDIDFDSTRWAQIKETGNLAYRTAMRGARGQTITRADDPVTHIVRAFVDDILSRLSTDVPWRADRHEQ